MPPPQRSSLIRRFEIKRAGDGLLTRVVDTVAAEEPLELRLKYWFKETYTTTPLALTMRTPGNDLEFAAGYLLTEGVIQSRAQLVDLYAIGAQPSNEVLAELSRDVDVDAWRLARSSFLGASCGLCGKRSLDALMSQLPAVVENSLTISPQLIEALPELLLRRQEGFAQTGGLHAAALISADGRLKSLFEDIGRHNALDKLIGSEFLAGNAPLQQDIIFLSSRSSFELIQKVAMAGAPVLATVGGPSSLAIEAARALGITLIGFVRQGRFNIYSGDWRVNSK
jgi:FdhD protein